MTKKGLGLQSQAFFEKRTMGRQSQAFFLVHLGFKVNLFGLFGKKRFKSQKC